MQLFYQPDIAKGANYLNSEESRHCIKVLRKKVGDEVTIIDGIGNFYSCRITEEDARKCKFETLSKRQETNKAHFIHIAIAPTKNMERLEWFVEKATEIGIDEISLVVCQNSERIVIKNERLFRKAVSAIKQSIKATLPKINEVVTFKHFIHSVHNQSKYIAHVDFENTKDLFSLSQSGMKSCVLIGPEGDFSQEEIKLSKSLGWQMVSLGQHRLRTETAGLAACHILNLVNY